MICYKVVKVENEKFYSCNAPGKYSIEYTIGQTSYPVEGTGELFVFKYESDAKSFLTLQDSLFCKKNLALLECETDSIEICEHRGSVLSEYLLEAYWKNFFENVFDAPQGTYLAKNLTPLKILEYGK